MFAAVKQEVQVVCEIVVKPAAGAGATFVILALGTSTAKPKVYLLYILLFQRGFLHIPEAPSFQVDRG